MKKVYLGPFNAERFWRKNSSIKLPHLKNKQDEKLLLAMEEMLFVFCGELDQLVTYYPIDEVFLEYLKEIGFIFHYQPCDARNNEQTLQELVLNDGFDKFDRQFSGAMLEPFSDVYQNYEISKKYSMIYDRPDNCVVSKVNSKIYSEMIKRHLDIGRGAYIIQSYDDLITFLDEVAPTGDYLLKEAFGVSGTGNIRIDSEAIRSRLRNYFVQRCNDNSRYEFVAEPFLNKAIDFSCQFLISKSGDVEIKGIQEMMNKNGAYMGAKEPSNQLLQKLENANYYQTVGEIGKNIYDDGYYGEVCIDSMVLVDGTIEPIIEINARKSMSLIKGRMDIYANRYGMKCRFYCIPVMFNGSSEIDSEKVLMAFSEYGLLFDCKKNGIVVLSTKTLLINNEEGKKCKGRFYFCILSSKEELFSEIYQDVHKVLAGLKMKSI